MDEAKSVDQADLSAEQARSQAPARIPRPHGQRRRAQGSVAPPGQGAQAPERVKPLARLKKRAEFLFVRGGVKAARGAVLIEARRRAADGPYRLGLTATKKIGGAVIRNRARRRLREAARALLPAHGAPGVDYVFVARAEAPSTPWAALLDDVGNALISVRAKIDAPAAAGQPARPKRPPKSP